METSKPIPMFRGQSLLLALACLVSPLLGGPLSEPTSTAAHEASRRQAAVEEARMLLEKGDEAYKTSRFADAIEAYAGALELIPLAPASAELRSAATQRFAQASVEHARTLVRTGDLTAAKAAVDKALQPDIAPNDPQALAFRSQLDDPIRTNPALDAEHGRSVDEVRRLLYSADGAFDLGKFDEATATYQRVIAIDPTNTAARRGLERISQAKAYAGQSAYDQTRAEMLGQVGAAWETAIAAESLSPTLEPGSEFQEPGTASVDALLDQIIIPKIILEQASLEEAVDFLRSASRQPGTSDQGVNFTVNLGPADSPAATAIRNRRFNLQLSQVPLRQILKVITEMTQTAFRTDDFSVLITPSGTTSDELVTRSYRVPPDFISSLSAGAEGDQASNDPFAEPAEGQGLLTRRLSAQEALARQGISFPEGASANYNAAANTLSVVNTPTNQEFIARIIDNMLQTEPVMVAVRVTMIRTEQTNLKELGFDWLVTPFGLGADSMFGAGGTIGNGQGRIAPDFISPVNGTTLDGIPGDPTGLVNPGVVTNGVRSGNGAVQDNSIDSLINEPSSSQQISAAPGILSLTGLFSDGQAQMIMRGLDQKKGVDLMARPSTVTRSGQTATVEILREFIYPTEYEPPELPMQVIADSSGSAPVTPATPSAFETKDVGIKLEVIPVADANKRYVDVTINPSFVDFDGFVNYGSPITSTATGPLGTSTVTLTDNSILMPIFSVRQANTQVTVADGSTIAIGGLMTQGVQNVEDSVPVLGSLPIVGRLFANKARRPVTSALVFLVHVELLDPTGRPYRNR